MMTGKTRYYSLGKYQKNDIVNIEADWNGNFSKIDTELKKNADDVSQYSELAEEITTAVPTMNQQIENWKQELNVDEAELNENAGNAVTAKTVATNANATAQKALSDVQGAVSIVNAAVATTNAVVQTNTNNTTALQGLNVRVSALEGSN